MNLSKLKVKMKVSNYKKMCELLEEPETTGGNNKASQLKDWECYFNYKKKGNSFIITEIYDKPKHEIDLIIKSKKGIYKEYVEKLIVDMMVQKLEIDGQNNIFLPTCTLLEQLYMVNYNYKECKDDIFKWSNTLNVEEDYIHDFYLNTYKNFKNIIDVALFNLDDKLLIVYDTIIIVVVKDGDREIHRRRTQAEKDLIFKCEVLALQKMNMTSKTSVILNKKWKTFQKIIYDILYEENKDIVRYYQAYDITFHTKIIERQKILDDFLSSNEEVKQLQQDLNTLICERTMINATNRHNRSDLKIEEEIINSIDPENSDIFDYYDKDELIEKIKPKKYDLLRSGNKYVENNKTLINALIKRE